MKFITDIAQLDFDQSYTYADYLTWWLERCIEIIKGKLVKVSPAPVPYHQQIAGNIYAEMRNYLKHKKCRVYIAPFDVRLVKNKEHQNHQIDTVVQPDICLICDVEKIDKRGCLGAPDLIVEILSDSTAARDLNEKFYLYEENHVTEYWIVNPDAKTLKRFLLVGGKYQEVAYCDEPSALIENTVLPDLKIMYDDIFD